MPLDHMNTIGSSTNGIGANGVGNKARIAAQLKIVPQRKYGQALGGVGDVGRDVFVPVLEPGPRLNVR